LDYKTVYLHFLEVRDVVTELVPDTTFPTVPIITNSDGKAIQDSAVIAQYIEEKYPEPTVFRGGSPLHFFFDNWVAKVMSMPIYRIILLKMHSELDAEAQAYVRETREKFWKMPLEEFAGDREEHIENLNEQLKLVAKTLKNNDYLMGDQVGYADIALASNLVMLEKIEPEILIDRILKHDGNEPIASWWKRMQQYADESQ
jgi:glutathione S-transferase